MAAVLSSPPLAAFPMSAFDNYKHAVLTTRLLPQSASQPSASQSYQHVQNTRPADTIPRYSLEALPPSPRGARGPPLAPHAPPEVPSNHFTAPRQPYLAAASSQAPRHISENVSYYSAQHHPYSTATPQSGYASTGGPDIMAATHAMRAPGPNMYSHQSASPVSAHSPHEPHNRIYGYNVNHHYYGPSHTPNYIAHPPPIQQQPPLAPRPTYSIQYSQAPPLQNHSQPQPASIISSPARTSVAQSPVQLKYPQISQSTSFPPTANIQPTSQVSPTSAQNNAAAPGPIPATTPLVVKQDSNGVQWIMFEYSRDRVKVQYEIRCDVESVDVKKLSKEHKDQNCVYPRACNKDSYQGNRLEYESQCNEVGWALAWLNPALQGKRGLIQRAVDSWRNSNANQKLRSRRVRRLAKTQKRSLAQAQIQSGSQVPPVTSASPVKANLQASHGQAQGGAGNGNASHHHHLPSEGGPQAEHSEAGPRGETRTHSPTDVRYTQSFRPVYPVNQGVGEGGSTIRDGAGNANQMANSNTITAALPNPEHVSQAAILGNLPYGAKPRKNMTVKDRQRDAQTRIIVRLDEMTTDDIPDNHRLKNSVFPRSYYARQRESVPLDDAEESDTSPIVAKTQVQIRLEDGWAAEFPVPKMRKSKRQRERMLNDFGCHIMWGGNIRHFDNRPLFLQQALNVFRRDVEDKSTKAGRPVSPLWQIRPGKRKWMERSKNVKQENKQEDSV